MRRREDSGKGLKIGMSIFIAAIMILSVFGAMLNYNPSELRYGKYKFTLDTTYNYYTTKISGKEMYFYTLPLETAYMNVSNATLDKLNNAAFIITTFAPSTANDSIQAIELARFDMANFMKEKQLFNVVSEPYVGYEAFPILTCANATTGVPVVTFNISDIPAIVDDGNCIYLNGRGPDFLRFRDRILYHYVGVI
jgi:glycosyltransferase involved in cell wall biosynthesis